MVERTPPTAEQVGEVIQQRIDALPPNALTENLTVEWRGTTQVLPVITMPIGMLYFNPDTHRVKAQRTLEPTRDKYVTEDPYGRDAQEYLRYLLRGDPKDPSKSDSEYEALKEDLRAHGQTDPGVVTRSGVLINGNTRCAALQELGREDIRVAVLPRDAAIEDFVRLELSLQLRKEYKRQYSFVNSLLAIDEQLAAGKPVNEILKAFRIKQTTFDRSRWILDLIREAIRRSTTNDSDLKAHAMRLVDFEDHQGKLEELQRTYTQIKATSSNQADALREARLLALALDHSKTDLRLIEPDFFTTYLAGRLPDGLIPQPVGAGEAALIPGLQVAANTPAAEVVSARSLTDQILKARALRNAGVGDRTAEELTEVVGDALDAALDASGKNLRLRKRRLAPSERIGDANDDLALSVDAIRDARATGEFKAEELDDSLLEMRQHLRTLWQLVERDDAAGEGLAWLKAQAAN